KFGAEAPVEALFERDVLIGGVDEVAVTEIGSVRSIAKEGDTRRGGRIPPKGASRAAQSSASGIGAVIGRSGPSDESRTGVDQFARTRIGRSTADDVDGSIAADRRVLRLDVVVGERRNFAITRSAERGAPRASDGQADVLG